MKIRTYTRRAAVKTVYNENVTELKQNSSISGVGTATTTTDRTNIEQHAYYLTQLTHAHD